MPKIGFAPNAKTYGEVIAAKNLRDRALAWLGDFLDKHLRGDGPLFPKDAPLHQGNCGVVAMCMLLDRPYSDVAPILGRGRSSGWTGSTFIHQYQPCADELGFSVSPSRSYRGTVGKLAAESKGTGERIFCTIHGHAMVIWDGLIFDQSYPAGGTPEERPEQARKSVDFIMRRQ